MSSVSSGKKAYGSGRGLPAASVVNIAKSDFYFRGFLRE